MIIWRALREAWMIFNFRRDAVRFLRSRGARIGDDVDIVSGHINMLGSEPYLVTIGNGVTLSDGVEIITHDGGLRAIRKQHPGAHLYRPVVVDDGAFIGARATILPGVTVGRRAVVGAGAVVTKDVPPETVVVGVPGRPIKSVEEYALASRDEWIDTTGMDARTKRETILRTLSERGPAREAAAPASEPTPS